MDKDRETESTFDPEQNCEYFEKCKLHGICWGAVMIRGQLNENASSCSNPQAEEAREEVRKLFASKPKQ